jgi:hypothetical protein
MYFTQGASAPVATRGRSVHTRQVERGVAHATGLFMILGGLDQGRALLLEELAESIVVLKLDTVLRHEVIVVKHGRVVDGETPTVSHSKTLRHLYYN